MPTPIITLEKIADWILKCEAIAHRLFFLSEILKPQGEK
jgi:hypothetical protein